MNTISKEQMANLIRYNNFRINESLISIIFEYLIENSLNCGKNESFEYLYLLYKNNELERFKTDLEEEIAYFKKLKKELTLSGYSFSKELKIYDLFENLFQKINKFVQ